MRSRLLLALGVLLVLTGLFVALKPLIGEGTPVTSSRMLDMAFAAFFLIRGAMNIRTATRPPPGSSPGAAPPFR